VLDAFSTEVPVYLDKRYEIDTDPVNIKHPVARGCQHQLSFLLGPIFRQTINIITGNLLNNREKGAWI